MNKECPMVSVIIPVYNTEKYLPKCLDSIVEQTYKNIEIVVVNNASSGNVVEIVDAYKRLYANRKWKIVTHNENQGLFKARISGVEASCGEYVAFVDSDDKISCDFYRLLIREAIINDCDMVASDVVYEMEDKSLFKSNLSIQEFYQTEIPSKDLLSLFYQCEGKCYSWHTVWNKIYSRSLWNQSYPYLKKIDEHIVMCEDYLFTTIFFAFAKKYNIIHNVCYYYFKGNNAYTSNKASIDKIYKNISDLGIVFKATKEFLVNIDRYNELGMHHKKFVERYYRIWYSNIENYEITFFQKKQMHSLLDKSLIVDDQIRNNPAMKIDDTYSNSLSTPVHDQLENLKICLKADAVKYISFDIFDTLILRPLFKPQDLFEFLNIKFRNDSLKFSYQFSDMRINAENAARERQNFEHSGYQDITLDEIYEELINSYGLSETQAEQMKAEEISLELEFCQPRKMGLELFELAKYLGKSIILISDMYLPKDIIQKMLRKCGFSGEFPFFLSSEARVTKHTGDLYKLVIKELHIPTKSSILHIGDNIQSDVQSAQRCGLKAIHLPRPVDVMTGTHPCFYSGSFFKEAFRPEYSERYDSALNFLGIRCMLATVANKLFDDPFVDYNPQSHFNASPYTIGYSTLGMYILGLSYWLNEGAKDYQKVHFIARDGYLVKQVFNKLFPNKDTDYLYVSRKSLLPLMIESPNDFMGLTSVLNATSLSPQKLFSLLLPILPEQFDITAFCEKNKILANKMFHTDSEFNYFLSLLRKSCYDKDRIISYRQEMRNYFATAFRDLDATFDVGYSGRTERLLGTLLEKRIDAFYVHINNESALLNAQNFYFKISCFFARSPLVAGTVRELLMSEIGPSCVGYTQDEHQNICPIFEDYSPEYPQNIILQIIHDSALDFVNDFCVSFKNYLYDMPFRCQDAAIPFEFFLNKSSIFDRWIFKIFDFEDDLFMGERVTVYDFWNMQTADSGTHILGQLALDISVLPVWKKSIIYALVDRKTLKEKAKKILFNHPIIFRIARIGYSVPRFIYHAIKRSR